VNLIILTQYYPPEHGAPQNRLHDLARRAVLAGHEVTVLTAMPNYPQGRVFPEYRGRFSCREEIDGVQVVRSWIFASKNKGVLAQLCVYFSFVFSSTLVGLFRVGRADFLICESPPLFLGASALKLAFLKRARLVMNISDLWPESAVQLGILGPGLKLRLLEWFEGLLYRWSALVTCQTEGIVDGVKMRTPGAKALLFPNGVDLAMFPRLERDPALAAELGLPDGHLIVGYGGNHGRSQALDQVLAAAKILSGGKIFFMLVGDGPEKTALEEKTKSMELANVRFYPSQPRQTMASIQALWDVALVPLRDIPLFDGARPSKMFELMAGGIPFLFCGRGEGADLAMASGCARVVPPENPEALAETIRQVAAMEPSERRQMGSDGRVFVSVNFDRAKIAERLLEALEKIRK
jgi:glycosyltransferase involved in cell wall biosynthesis